MPALNSVVGPKGWKVISAPASDGARATARMDALLPALRPAVGESQLRAAISANGRGTLLRYRPHRAAFLLEDAELAAALGCGARELLHVKVYAPKDALEKALEVGSSSRGRTSWRLGRAMWSAGIATPEPLLLMEKKPWRVHHETVLVTRALAGPVLLTDELKLRAAGGTSIRPLLSQAAVLAADLHVAGFFHGDFTASNLVLAGPTGARALFVIDLDRTKSVRLFPAPVRRRVEILDLRMLLLTSWGEVSRREWLRVLAAYARRRRLGRGSAHALAGRVLAARRGRVRVGAAAPTLGGREPWAR
jgi:hypothetical protein